MPATVITLINTKVKFSPGVTKPPDWSAAGTIKDFSCQVTAAEVQTTENDQDVPATMCQGPLTIPQLSSYGVRLAGLQDITEATGLSMFLYANDAKEGWLQVVGPDQGTGVKQFTIEANVTFRAASMAGDAGTPLTFEVTLPCRAKPTISQATGTTLAATGAENEEVAA